MKTKPSRLVASTLADVAGAIPAWHGRSTLSPQPIVLLTFQMGLAPIPDH